MTAPEDRAQPDPARRTLIRGVAAVGLAGVAGIPLSACGSGGDDAQASGAAPATQTTTDPTTRPTAGSTTQTRPTGKSEVYQRTPEPRGKRTAAPESAPDPSTAPAARADPAGPASKGDDLATAKQKGGKAEKGRPVKTGEPATPAPLPPGALARTSDIPVGGGKTFEAEKIVVTQPTKGTFKGFSATCTHTGCAVDKIDAGSIICPCHGSRFAIADGAVQKGPALMPLPPAPIAVTPDGVITKG